MGNEQQLILKMLEEGKISVDEAERLLKAIGEEDSPKKSQDIFQGLGDMFEDFGRKFESFFKHDFQGFQDIFSGGEAEEYTAPTETSRFELGDSVSIQMAHRHGNVQIATWDEPAVSVQTAKKVRAESSEAASEILDAIEIETQLDGNVLTLNTAYPEDQELWQGKRHAQVEYTITVPRQTNGALSVRHGNMNVERITGPLALAIEHGNVTVKDMDDKLVLSGAHGNVHAENIGGDVTAKRKHGKLVLRNIGSDVVLDGGHGKVDVAQVQGDLHLKWAHNTVQVQALQGNFDILHRHGSVKLDGVPKSEGECRIETSHGSTHLVLPESTQAAIHASTHHGRIHSAFEGQYVDERLGQELRAGDDECPLKIELKAHHGNIHIEKKGEADE